MTTFSTNHKPETKMETKTINIHGVPFTVSAPYAEGHVLTAIEARSLNQTRAENIGNNFRKSVAEAKDDPAKLEALKAELADYDSKYTFAMRVAREPVDPLERAARAVAKEVLNAHIKKTLGVTVKAYLATEGNEDKYEANLEKLMVRDDVLKVAKERVKASKKVSDISLDEGI